jgi:hypothetical protein
VVQNRHELRDVAFESVGEADERSEGWGVVAGLEVADRWDARPAALGELTLCQVAGRPKLAQALSEDFGVLTACGRQFVTSPT